MCIVWDFVLGSFYFMFFPKLSQKAKKKNKSMICCTFCWDSFGCQQIQIAEFYGWKWLTRIETQPTHIYFFKFKLCCVLLYLLILAKCVITLMCPYRIQSQRSNPTDFLWAIWQVCTVWNPFLFFEICLKIKCRNLIWFINYFVTKITWY